MRIEDKDPAKHAGIEYPMEVGAPVFAPIKVVEEKDKAVNVARQNAKLEYDRIMEQAEVLMRQARALQARLDATEWFIALSSVLIPYTVKPIIFTMIKEMPRIFSFKTDRRIGVVESLITGCTPWQSKN